MLSIAFKACHFVFFEITVSVGLGPVIRNIGPGLLNNPSIKIDTVDIEDEVIPEFSKKVDIDFQKQNEEVTTQSRNLAIPERSHLYDHIFNTLLYQVHEHKSGPTCGLYCRIKCSEFIHKTVSTFLFEPIHKQANVPIKNIMKLREHPYFK